MSEEKRARYTVEKYLEQTGLMGAGRSQKDNLSRWVAQHLQAARKARTKHKGRCFIVGWVFAIWALHGDGGKKNLEIYSHKDKRPFIDFWRAQYVADPPLAPPRPSSPLYTRAVCWWPCNRVRVRPAIIIPRIPSCVVCVCAHSFLHHYSFFLSFFFRKTGAGLTGDWTGVVVPRGHQCSLEKRKMIPSSCTRHDRSSSGSSR